MEFPYLTDPHRDTMVDLISAMENRLGSHHLLPSSVPPDVEHYQNESGTSQGTLHIRCGIDSSPIDFVLASWLHLEQPTGGALDITNIAGYLKSSTDVPHFQFELVKCSPTFLILFLDLIPRKDIVFSPDYLKTYYEDTQLEKFRQRLDQLPEVQPYFSSSLYFRRVVSPTGIVVSIKCEDGAGPERVEEIIREHVRPISNDIMRIWIDMCVGEGVEVGETERAVLEKRDSLIKSKAIEMDLSSSMPKQFGQEVADRVLRVIKSVYNV